MGIITDAFRVGVTKKVMLSINSDCSMIISINNKIKVGERDVFVIRSISMINRNLVDDLDLAETSDIVIECPNSIDVRSLVGGKVELVE